MPKRSSKHIKRPDAGLDTVQNARRVMEEALRRATPEIEEVPISRSTISQVMAEMGRKGGKIGGKRRLVTMTAHHRRQVAKQAARARWGKKKKPAA